jgi:hypothetical protein
MKQEPGTAYTGRTETATGAPHEASFVGCPATGQLVTVGRGLTLAHRLAMEPTLYSATGLACRPHVPAVQDANLLRVRRSTRSPLSLAPLPDLLP